MMRVPKVFSVLAVLAVLLLAVSPVVGQRTYRVSGKVTMELTGVGAGVGVSWGTGVLFFEGGRYPFKIHGVGVGDVGISKAKAEGTVYNLLSVPNFPGDYTAVGAGVAVAGGVGDQRMQNERGVIIDLHSVSQGVSLNIGPKGFTIEMQ